jgi:hypothetical protein
MVACPQNGTSHSGEKYRTRHPSPSGVAKAVSENPTSAAIACMSDADGKSSPIQIPAGLPPLLLSENAAMRRTVMLVILFPVHLSHFLQAICFQSLTLRKWASHQEDILTHRRHRYGPSCTPPIAQ